jgi:hypothetical protein
MSSAILAFRRMSLLVCSAVTIVTACAACTVAIKPQDKSNDEAPPAPPVAVAPAPVVIAPPPVAAVAAAAPRVAVAAPAQRPIAQPVAAAPVARAPNRPAPPSASRGTFASGRVCGLDSSCASGVCLPTPGSAFGKCK